MLTLSAIKADVGSIGGHTRPSVRMVEAARTELRGAADRGLVLDFDVTHCGDDICLLMVHRNGSDNPDIHNFAWGVFEAATAIAQEEGLYGAGQDLLKDAPSGNVRGAGPGAAEITFDETAKDRPAEPFMVFTADKCGPGAFNFPLWTVFTSPLYNAGLMLPKMKPGFRFTVIDMEYAGADRIIELESPEQHIDLAILLRDENRFGVKAISSRLFPDQQVVAVSTDRLHTIAGEYKGKDDPVCIVRTQGIFPAPEEVVSPYFTAHYVAGDARGSHHMPFMPAPINTAITSAYCIPLVACMAYSVTKAGKLSDGVDVFDNPVWDSTRLKAQEKADEMRRQGFVGPAMLPMQELEYSAFRSTLAELEEQFRIVEKPGE
ncbi:MAG: fructose 1,6-bisphosphatase [Gemmatimonadetes bacterium]|nr:fructose 1,6-bisphosphatase [Gemmatimonadota bacterium]NIO31682.1 fructose 1,6-bisphosphatase [Gemmatimonadota bacterium]